jgi:hypothetical protein
MSFKQVAFCLGCAAAWFVLLPLFVVGGGVALMIYAVFGELGEFLVGRKTPALAPRDAREMARRVCLTR